MTNQAAQNGLIVILICLISIFPISAEAAQKREKILLDTDMVEAFDDGIAMLMLAKSPNIQLLGVTTVTGNTWAKEGAAYGLRQLEAIGMEKEVPLVIGEEYPTRKGRIENMKQERIEFGRGYDDYTGAAMRPNPASWRDVYKKAYGEEPKSAPLEKDAADFIIEQVRKYPGEVTIVAVGPCTNIAKAIQRAPEIVPLVKRIIYMGGAFFVPGNVTPAAEFNWWFDPESAKAALRAPFKEQTIVPLDPCVKVRLTPARYREVSAVVKNPKLAEMMRRQYKNYFGDGRDPDTYFIWDALTALALIDPTVVTESVALPVDVNDTYSLSYGESLAFKGIPPIGAQKAKIILSIDEPRAWKMLLEACGMF
ncbi:MAG: nucleoside hydrolase [Synergistaceae bacterium]|nr:nucleoside hydrolase [Synergistaceae bacterium]